MAKMKYYDESTSQWVALDAKNADALSDGINLITPQDVFTIDNKIESHSNDSSIHFTSTERTKLAGISANANNYILPNATTSIIGGVKVGTNLTITSGTVSVANASTTVKGVVQLETSITSDSEITAATPKAVKQVNASLETLKTNNDYIPYTGSLKNIDYNAKVYAHGTTTDRPLDSTAWFVDVIVRGDNKNFRKFIARQYSTGDTWELHMNNGVWGAWQPIYLKERDTTNANETFNGLDKSFMSETAYLHNYGISFTPNENTTIISTEIFTSGDDVIAVYLAEQPSNAVARSPIATKVVNLKNGWNQVELNFPVTKGIRYTLYHTSTDQKPKGRRASMSGWSTHPDLRHNQITINSGRYADQTGTFTSYSPFFNIKTSLSLYDAHIRLGNKQDVIPISNTAPSSNVALWIRPRTL